MLYKKNLQKELDNELFRNPTSEYRATPFWAWNCKLDKDELCRQIEIFKEMGLGGFHMHVRKHRKSSKILFVLIREKDFLWQINYTFSTIPTHPQ